MNHLNHSSPDFNTVEPDRDVARDSSLSLHREFLRLGAELGNRGPRPVAEFVSELAGLAPDLAEEIQARLQAYTRIDAATYKAVGADTFLPFMIVLDGGRDDTP